MAPNALLRKSPTYSQFGRKLPGAPIARNRNITREAQRFTKNHARVTPDSGRHAPMSAAVPKQSQMAAACRGEHPRYPAAMDWTAPINIYCERLDPSFWAEPLNAVTNLSFVAAAIWAYAEARRRAEPNPLVWVLIALAAVIGVGSFLFHTFANRWSALADVLPIWVFVALYVLVALNRLGGIRPGRILGGLAAVVALIAVYVAMREGGAPGTPASPPAPDPFNGSLQYLPAVIAFAMFAVITQRNRHPLRGMVLMAGAAFLVSLTARTLDRDICTALPIGTHFIWHLMNGLVIGLVLQILIRSRPIP